MPSDDESESFYLLFLALVSLKSSRLLKKNTEQAPLTSPSFPSTSTGRFYAPRPRQLFRCPLRRAPSRLLPTFDLPDSTSPLVVSFHFRLFSRVLLFFLPPPHPQTNLDQSRFFLGNRAARAAAGAVFFLSPRFLPPLRTGTFLIFPFLLPIDIAYVLASFMVWIRWSCFAYIACYFLASGLPFLGPCPHVFWIFFAFLSSCLSAKRSVRLSYRMGRSADCWLVPQTTPPPP